jgi:hypothetical protein
MDVRKHLRGLGWQGEGHSLGKHATGLKKPLLISHKTTLHGLGAKSQKEKQADQWWLNAFDNALKDIGTGKESSLSKVRDNGGRGGLYGFFVRGVGLDGTIDESCASTGTSTPSESEAGQMKTTVTLSVSDLAGSSASKEEKKRSKKAKLEKKDKKRKREEDPVDSHQDEPEAKKTKSVSSSNTDGNETAKVPKKNKKKQRSKNASPEPLLDNKQTEVSAAESIPDLAAEIQQPVTDKESSRKAKEERKARKAEKRRSKNATPEPAADDVQTDAPPVKPAPTQILEKELPDADKRARRKAKEDKKARKAEKRRLKEHASDGDDTGGKKEKSIKKSKSKSGDVK